MDNRGGWNRKLTKETDERVRTMYENNKRNTKISKALEQFYSINKNKKIIKIAVKKSLLNRNYHGEKNPNYKHGRDVDSSKGVEIFEKSRKKFKCEICGETKGNIKNCRISIHHKDGNRKNNKLDNLQPLCQACHTRHHRKGYRKNAL